MAIVAAMATTRSQRSRRSRAGPAQPEGDALHCDRLPVQVGDVGPAAGRRTVADDPTAAQLDDAVRGPGDLAIVGDDEDGPARPWPGRAAAPGSGRRSGSRARRSARRRAAPGCRWPARGRWPRAAARRRRAGAGSGRCRSARPTSSSRCRAIADASLRPAASAPNSHVLERREAREEVEGLEDEAAWCGADSSPARRARRR